MLANISIKAFETYAISLASLHSWTFVLCFTVLLASSINRYYNFQYYWFSKVLPSIRFKQGSNGVVHLYQNGQQFGVFFKYKYFPTNPIYKVTDNSNFYYFVGIIALITGALIEEHEIIPAFLFFMFVWAGYLSQNAMKRIVDYSLHEGILRAGYKTY